MSKAKTKTVLITGAAGKIGIDLVRAFIQNNDIVIALDKHVEALEMLNYKSENLTIIRADLTDEAAVLMALSQVKAVNVLINNAATSCNDFITNVSLDAFDHVYFVNVRAPFYLSKWFVSQHDNSTYGRIINIASTRAFMSSENTEAYSASKGALIALTHSLAVSLSNTPIRVNSISPGWIHSTTEPLRVIDHTQHPSGRVGTPEDIARACLFLCDEANDFINGQNIIIDGGMSVKMIYEP